MITPIELFTSATGWVGPGGSTFNVNQVPDYIANYLPGSLIIYIPPNSAGQGFVKTVAASFPGASSIVLSVWSRQLRRVNQNKPADYAYEIDFGNSNIFMLPTPMEFDAVDIGLNGWSSVTQIKIIPTSNAEDWIILSGCYAVADDYPLDVFVGAQAGIQQALASFSLPVIGSKVLIAGQTSIPFSPWPQYLERGAVIKITDGVNIERHQIQRWDETGIWFTSLYDGQALAHAYNPGTITLEIPVEYGVLEKEAVIPAITIWGLNPVPDQSTSDVSTIVDTYTPSGGAAVRKAGMQQTYELLIDCESRSVQILALAARIVKWWIGQQTIWINGRRNDLSIDFDSVAIDPPDSTIQIPKIQFRIKIDAFEDRQSRTFMSAFTTPAFNFTPKIGVLPNVHTGGTN